MSLFSVFSRPLLLTLPVAILAFSSCGKDDEPVATPVPDKGRVLVSHAAVASNTQLTAFIADQQVAQLNYGQSTPSYLSVNAGSPALRINNGAQVAANKTLAITKDQSYSAFIYSPTANIGGTTEVLTVSDDLTPPTTGVKIRLVNLLVGAPSPLQITVPSPTPGGADTHLTPDVAFGAASTFVLLNAGPHNLSVTSAGTGTTTARTPELIVGDGTGTGTGTKTYEAGKIYTIVVRGIKGTGVPAAQQPQSAIIQNN